VLGGRDNLGQIDGGFFLGHELGGIRDYLTQKLFGVVDFSLSSVYVSQGDAGDGGLSGRAGIDHVFVDALGGRIVTPIDGGSAQVHGADSSFLRSVVFGG